VPTTLRARDRVATRWNSLPGWAAALVIFGASRLISTALLGILFAVATGNGWPFASYRRNANFFTFSGSWDGSAYRIIGEQGYPVDLPVDGAGHVAHTVWAFLPLYPRLVASIAAPTGLDFYLVGTLVSTIFGALASIALYALLASRIDRAGALWAVTLFTVGPFAFLLQVAYAESMFLFLLFGALWAMVRRRYLVVAALGVLAAFTRPGALAIPLALGILFVLRWRESRKPGAEPFPVAERVRMAAAAALVAAAGLAWTGIAAAVTGRSDAYLASELAYWSALIGHQAFVPFAPWFLLASRYLGWIGVILVLAVAGGTAWYLTRRRLRMLGPEIIAFSASYALYLFAVFLPQQSIFRLMLPLAPLLGDPALRRSRRWRIAIVACCVLAQAAAIVVLWFLSFP
jgi:hypothetical protein